MDMVEYLGYILTLEGLSMDPAKVETIQNWLEPWKVQDVQSFLGFANFYQRFIHNYSEIATPLMRLTKKGITWYFSDECRAAFTALKTVFTMALILLHWIPEALIIIETDTSDYAIATILSITTTDGKVHSVAFHSWKMNPMELYYNTHDKELLVIHQAFKIWWKYLEGTTILIDVITDHKNLEYFSTTCLLTYCQVRWSEDLSKFNFVIWFCPGKLGTKPDALTIWWDIYPTEGDNMYAHINPQNLCLIFSEEHLKLSLCASSLTEPILWATIVMDEVQLWKDVWNALWSDLTATQQLDLVTAGNSEPRWTQDSTGLLWNNGLIYVPDSDSGFSSTSMTTSFQDILASTKPLNSSNMTIPGQASGTLSSSTASCYGQHNRRDQKEKKRFKQWIEPGW
jgi:hypothetical protein